MTRQKKLVMPDAFIIIFGIVMLAAIATYIIPAGSFTRETVEGITKVVPNSYELVDSNPTNLLFLFKSIQLGMIQSAAIIFLIFIIGGIVKVIESTGAIDSGIFALIEKTKGRQSLLIASVAGIFSLLATMGLSPNIVIVFIPIGIALARSLKLDAITGVATIYLGYYSGMIAGVFDATILGFAQTIAELPLFSGIYLRVIIYFVLITITVLYTIRYAKKITTDSQKSIMADNLFGESEEEKRHGTEHNVAVEKFTLTHKLVLFTFIFFIGIFVYGAFTRGWGINDLVGLFIIMGVVVAIIARISPNQFIKTFIEGAQAITYGALVVGIARAVVVILENGYIIDTIVNGALVPLQSASVFIGAQLLFFFNLLFNLLVTSGTGQASIVMPIMVPIVDILGITRQTATLAFMLGDGFTNIITPTSGVLMAVLAVGRVKWVQWIKFAFPLLLMWMVVGVIAISFAVLTNYGPF